MTTIIETTVHYPPGVTKVLGFSFSHLIGYIDSVNIIYLRWKLGCDLDGRKGMELSGMQTSNSAR
jgi:hypothetical protein